jgi:hypothetical protein
VTRHRALIAGVVVCSVASVAHAVPQAFTLDPAASTLTISGTLLGQPFVAQNPGSLTTGYAGTLMVDLNGNGFTLESNTPNALDQLLGQRPGNGTTDAQPANYGLMRQGPVPESVYAAIQSLDVYVSTAFGPPVQLDAGGHFNPADVGMFINGGSLYWTAGGPSNYVDLHGTGAPNSAATQGSLVTAGGVQTLTLPVRLTGTRDVLAPGDTVLVFEGQFVATRAVPAPGAAALGAGGAVALMGRRRRR